MMRKSGLTITAFRDVALYRFSEPVNLSTYLAYDSRQRLKVGFRSSLRFGNPVHATIEIKRKFRQDIQTFIYFGSPLFCSGR